MDLSNETMMWWLFGASAVMFVGSLLTVPWLVSFIPADYFVDTDHEPVVLADRPVLRMLARILANFVGLVLIAAGIAMLVLPGQGILTIIVGLLMTSFPGKRPLLRWVVRKSWVHRTIDKLRRRRGKPPLQLEIADQR